MSKRAIWVAETSIMGPWNLIDRVASETRKGAEKQVNELCIACPWLTRHDGNMAWERIRFVKYLPTSTKKHTAKRRRTANE